ncbi:hypothetical protein ScPMuIL_018671 [Solemya velum]
MTVSRHLTIPKTCNVKLFYIWGREWPMTTHHGNRKLGKTGDWEIRRNRDLQTGIDSTLIQDVKSSLFIS